MGPDAFKTNLKTVKEFILDEHKLVTYISLSKELCIHVNDAKSLLWHIIKDIRTAQPEIDLCVCYMISGLQSNNRGCTTVCTETDLDGLKKTLDVIFYEHVYCVSRGLKTVDNAALTAVNKFEDLSLCTGLIKANTCTVRTEDEIENLTSKIHVAIAQPKPIEAKVQQKNSQHAINKVTKNGHEISKKDDEVKSEPTIKSEIPSPKKDVLNNNKTTTSNNGKKATTKGIAGFFNKVNGDSTKVKNNKVQKTEVNMEKDTKVKQEKDVKVKEENNIESIVSKPDQSVPTIKNSKEKLSSNSNLTQIKKTAKVDKKRKRLLHVSDSDSETEENDPFTNGMDIDHESEDEIPPTPTVSTVKITSGIVNPKKRRKIVDKTYTDEDGYILTKKEEVYESCSDNEDEVKENAKQLNENGKLVKENSEYIKKTKQSKDSTEQVRQIKTETSPKETKSKKKKVSPPQKGKQSTINSFFKKV